jgi:hypothetical protein
MRRGYGPLFLLYVFLAPVALVLLLLYRLYQLARYVYRRTIGQQRSAQRAIWAYQQAPQRALAESQRRANIEAARRAEANALRRGDLIALQSAWKQLDDNGGDYQ